MKISRQKIECLQAEMHLSTEELCERMGMSRQNFSVIKGRETCYPKTAGKIAVALGVPVQEIVPEN